MFHRFHDIKNNQDGQMMQGNSRSGTPVAPQDIRPPMFPHVLRPDASLTPQQTLPSTYPSSSSPSPSSSFVSQGGQLMPLGANIMYPGMKALGVPAQEAHRFMTEAYKVATEDPQKLSFLNPSRISETAQSHVSEQTRNTEDLEQISSNAQRQTVGSDQTRISGDNIPRLPYESQGSSSLQQLTLDPQRLEAETQRMLASMERLPTNDQQKIVGETQRIPQTRTTEGSQYSKTPFTIEDLKPKVPHGPAASSSSLLYSGPFSSSYLHYQDEALYKRHPYNDLSHGKRSSETRDASGEGSSSQERNSTPGDIMSHHLDMIGYNRGAYEQGGTVNASDTTQSDSSRSDDFTSSLDLVNRHTAARGPKDVFKARVPRVRQSKTHKCDYCELEFKNSTQLKNHTWRHTGEKPYSCELCHATFTQQSNLKTHMRIHTGERPYACEECSATFTQLSNLRTHQKTHTGEKPHECDVCGTRFSQQSNLKSHKMIHSGERPFKCDECESTFVQSTHLRNHMRIHTDERPYACNRCGARFRQLSNLKTHEKTHTGEKPHICDECGAAFAQKSNLKSHKIKLHSGEVQPSKRGRKKLEGIKPCICEECGAKFTLMSNLKIHMKLHTGEKPYTCSMCNACFAQRSNLKTHEKVHSDERPYQCNECPAAFKQKTNLKTHKMKRHPVKSLKIKILQDSQFMRHEGEVLDREGSTASFIGEPIVQIREGRDPHGEFAGNSADEEYSEGDLRYGEEGTMQQVGTCAPYPIAPNYMAPSGGGITRMEENPFEPKF